MRFPGAISFSILVALCATGTHAATLSSTTLAPFVIPWDDGVKGVATDVSFLNDSPAGKNGFITVRNGHFAESKTGNRIRFLGTNLTFDSVFPSHSDAAKLAAHLAKLGMNIVRIHHHDWNQSPLWAKSNASHIAFDPVALDRLDYLIAQLKKNGIYLDLNLHVSRKFVSEDGFPNTVDKIDSIFDKRIDNFDRRMVDLQKQFARDYLTHVNPYTGMSYVADPAVAIIEINNENTLAGSPNDDVAFFDRLPEPFRGEVVSGWNNYLLRKYGTTARLKIAWAAGASLNGDAASDLLGSAQIWSIEDRSGDMVVAQSAASTTTKMPGVAIMNPTIPSAPWHKQLHVNGLTLTENALYTLSFRSKSDVARALDVYTAIDQEDWRHTGLEARANVSAEWREFRYTFQATRTLPKHCRVSFVIGGSTGMVSLADVRLKRSDDNDIIPTGQGLEMMNLNLPSFSTLAQKADWRRFLVDSEIAYATEMRSYLRNELKVHGNIIDTQMEYGEMAGFAREEDSDFADNHGYWQHPAFPNNGWDESNWVIGNTPMTDALASGKYNELVKLACYRVAGKPYTITEYNHAAPSEYQAEMFPEIASFAALQDWDALFQFDYGAYGGTWGGGPRDRIQNFFAMQGNPASEAFTPSAALIFRSGALAPLATVARAHFPISAPYSTSSVLGEWKTANGGKIPDILSSRLEAGLDASVTNTKIEIMPARTEASSAQAFDTKRGSLYLARGSKGVAGAGYIGGQTIDLGSAKFQFADFGNGFGAFALTTLDSKPLDQSLRILLTISGKTSNLGVVWNTDHNSIGRYWGHGPVQAEVIPGVVAITNPNIRHIWALGPTGQRLKELPVTIANCTATFTLAPEWATVWYELAN